MRRDRRAAAAAAGVCVCLCVEYTIDCRYFTPPLLAIHTYAHAHAHAHADTHSYQPTSLHYRHHYRAVCIYVLCQHASSRLLRILLSFPGRVNLRGTRRRRGVYPSGFGRARGGTAGRRARIIVCEHVAFIYTVARAHGRASPPKLDYNTLPARRRISPECYTAEASSRCIIT